jgi:pimeloyl-ACP methyl ester carboxylesterase
MPYKNDLFNDLASPALAYIPYGGIDYGEAEAIARAVGDGDTAAFYVAWSTAADRRVQQVQQAQTEGHGESARALLLKAACFYGISYRPLFGTPVDPRLTAAFKSQMDVFAKAAAMLDSPAKAFHVPYESTTLPAYSFAADRAVDHREPLLIFTSGYDTTVTDEYFGSIVAATRRGYDCFVYDGPGQGAPLILDGIPMRPDWENVVKPVIDFIKAIPDYSERPLVLLGWSFGGYLALRAAAHESRLAACVADPGLSGAMSVFGRVTGRASADQLQQKIDGDPGLRWRFVQRGFWVQGKTTLAEFLTEMQRYDLGDSAKQIQCPTLLTMAENDPLAAGAPQLYDGLTCPKTLLHFAAADGAGGHCEMGNRSLLNDSVLDWIDDTI